MENNEEDVFEYPPINENGYQNFSSSNPEVAWKQKLVEIHHLIEKVDLPEKLKNQIRFNIDQILTNAGMTYISSGQILEFLLDWDNKMHVMKIMNPDIDTPEFHDFKRSIRMELKLQLNKSKEGWQGNHAFETHVKQDIRQRHENTVEKLGRWFGRGKKRKMVETTEM